MENAFQELCALLPECTADIAALCRGAEYFELDESTVRRAAALLPEHHALKYKGVRMLLSACVEEFAECFSPHGAARCEVTVPAPTFAMLALQNAAGERLALSSSAFFAQIMLRGILDYGEPMSLASCAKRRCGLNVMRERMLASPCVAAPEYQLQFSVLCDECAKAGEGAGKKTQTATACFSYGDTERFAREFYARVEKMLGVCVARADMQAAFALYGRLLRAQRRIEELSRREEYEVLCGNSFALAQSVMLMTTPRMERFVTALEELSAELENAAPRSPGKKRIYCYYIPFLLPGIDRLFREAGAELVGGAAFCTAGSAAGFDMAQMTAAWVDTLMGRASPETQCDIIAREMRLWHADTYLTGAFGFDRCLGAAVPLRRKILREKHGIKTAVLDADFWSENAMFGSLENRIEQIAAG